MAKYLSYRQIKAKAIKEAYRDLLPEDMLDLDTMVEQIRDHMHAYGQALTRQDAIELLGSIGMCIVTHDAGPEG